MVTRRREREAGFADGSARTDARKHELHDTNRTATVTVEQQHQSAEHQVSRGRACRLSGPVEKNTSVADLLEFGKIGYWYNSSYTATRFNAWLRPVRGDLENEQFGAVVEPQPQGKLRVPISVTNVGISDHADNSSVRLSGTRAHPPRTSNRCC